MNKDRMKGTAKEAAGKMKKATGKTFGNRQMEAEGAAKQFEGRMQNMTGKTKDALRDAAKKQHR